MYCANGVENFVNCPSAWQIRPPTG